MIAGRKGPNVRFQRMFFGMLLAVWLIEWVGITPVHWIAWTGFMLTLLIEFAQVIWAHRRRKKEVVAR
jgi:Flp pilus assembly protein TadB